LEAIVVVYVLEREAYECVRCHGCYFNGGMCWSHNSRHHAVNKPLSLKALGQGLQCNDDKYHSSIIIYLSVLKPSNNIPLSLPLSELVTGFKAAHTHHPCRAIPSPPSKMRLLLQLLLICLFSVLVLCAEDYYKVCEDHKTTTRIFLAAPNTP